MKVLYATYRYDPQNPDLGSGLDHECFLALSRAGFEIKIIGPVTNSPTFLERAEQYLGRLYKKITGKSFLKFPLTTAWRASKMLDHAARLWNPDVIFSVFPPFFVFTSTRVPIVWELDTTFLGQEEALPIYGKTALGVSVWEEKRALALCTKIITMSEWSKQVLIEQYNTEASCIEVIPMASALPDTVIPPHIDIETEKKLEFPIKILLVGRVYARKGIDIAIEVVTQLNSTGIPTQLTVCGLNNSSLNQPAFIQFVGPYRKSDPMELQEYVSWYKWAHLLIHPARFEAAGIVPSEAAAFGTPTITNDVGGLGTTVKDGISGIVLQKNSTPSAYVEAIKKIISQPNYYYDLCKTTRQRYERELNPNTTGKKIVKVLQEAVTKHHQVK